MWTTSGTQPGSTSRNAPLPPQESGTQWLGPHVWSGCAPQSKLATAQGGVREKSSTSSQLAWLTILCVPSSSQIIWGLWAWTPCSQPKVLMKSAATWCQTPSCFLVEAMWQMHSPVSKPVPSATSRICLTPEPILIWKGVMPNGLCFKQENKSTCLRKDLEESW